MMVAAVAPTGFQCTATANHLQQAIWKQLSEHPSRSCLTRSVSPRSAFLADPLEVHLGPLDLEAVLPVHD